MWVINRLYQFILKQPVAFLTGSFFMIIGMSLDNVTPFLVKWLTESLQAQELDKTFQLIVGFGILLLIRNLITGVAYYLTDKSLVGTSTRLSHAVLTHIHNLDFAYHTNKSSGQLISLMKRGDDSFFTFYDILNRQFLNIFLSFLIMLGAFTQLQFQYVIFVLGLIILSICSAAFLVKQNVLKRNIFNLVDDELSSVRVDNLVNFDTVKYFAHEEFEQNKYKSLLQKWDKALQDYFFTFRFFDLVLGNLINVGLVGMMLLALRDVRQGSMSLGDFLLVTTFSMALLPKMMGLLFNLRDLAKKYSDLKNYFMLLEEKISVLDPIQPVALPTGHGEIQFQQVTFTYGNSATPILKNFDLTIKNGEAVALVGYSGAGKTTIAKLLMRMYDAESGAITINGVNVTNLTKETLRTHIGIVPQDPLLFNNTIYYNIAYARQQASEAEVLAAATAAKVTDFVNKLEKGFETLVGERGIKLSGGQRQRLAIARILLEQPEILVLDEATSALDSASEQMIQTAFWNLVRDSVRPRTAIIIAHRLSTIMKADRIIVMDKGRIVEMGTHTELLAKGKGIYHELWSLQKNGFIGDGEVET